MAGIKSKRFAEMDETGRYMVKEMSKLEKILRNYEVFSDRQLSSYSLDYFKSKIKRKPLRAYFCRKLFEYLSDGETQKPKESTGKKKRLTKTEQLFCIKLPFVFEMIIVIQYLHNHILDDKYGVRKAEGKRVNHNLISSNILRELLFLYIYKEVRPLLEDENQVFRIHQHIAKLFLYVDLGQRLDKEYNTYPNWYKSESFPHLLENRFVFDSFIRKCINPYIDEVKQAVPGKENFVEGYFQRIYLTNVYFFECMGEIVMFLLGHKRRRNNKLRKFSIQYGFMLQIINDYADFAYSDDPKEQKQLQTAGKKTTDYFADLYNFNITLPLIYHLSTGGGRRKIEAYLEGGRKRKNILTRYPAQIVNEIKDSDAILHCIQLTRKLSQEARICLDKENVMTPYLVNMCDMAFDNKFYKVFI